MEKRTRCPPVKFPQEDDPPCCGLISSLNTCCRPAVNDKSEEEPSQEVLYKLQREYDKLTASDSESLLKKYLNLGVFEQLKMKLTPQGSSLLDVVQCGLENFDADIGVYAPDSDSYSVFAPLFDPIISEIHKFGPTAKQPPLQWGDPKLFKDLDPEGMYIRSVRVRCKRSIKGFPFAPKMKLEHYNKLQQQVSDVLLSLDGYFAGEYKTLSDLNQETQQRLIENHFLFKEGNKFQVSAKVCEFWPTGRGIFMNEQKTFIVWVGAEDHIRIISMEMGGKIGDVYERFLDGMNKIEEKLQFVHHQRLGYITVNPKVIGTALRASVMMRLPIIGQEPDRLKIIADRYNLKLKGISGEGSEPEDYTYDVSNKRGIGLTEFEVLSDVHYGVQEMIRMEELVSRPSVSK